MRVFLTLCALAAVAYAKPQGYKYGAGVSGGHSSIGGGFLQAPSTGSHGGFSHGGGFSSGGSGFIGGGSSGIGSGNFGSGGFGSGSGSSGFGGGFSSGGSSGSGGGFGFGGGAGGGGAGFGETLVHKQFYTISAPEDNENLEQTKHLVIGRPQRNYRVVFIKAPSSSAANVKLSAEYAPQEEKTAIYVLTKKDSTLDVISDIATPAPTAPSKPDVFFIKYKTEEEAQHAQREIQAEYDRIEGTSEHADGGIAPVQSVVGALGGDSGSSSSSSGGSSGGFGGGSIGSGSGTSHGFGHGHGRGGGKTYLPPGSH